MEDNAYALRENILKDDRKQIAENPMISASIGKHGLAASTPDKLGYISKNLEQFSKPFADQLKEFKAEVDKHIEKGLKKDEAILKVLRQYIVDSKAIRFEGNGYSDEWEKEAAKRGLPNVKTTPVSLDAYAEEKAKKLFEDHHIYNHLELRERLRRAGSEFAWRGHSDTETLLACVTTWGFEAEGPSTLTRAGIRKSDFSPGTEITITGHPMKDGRPAAAWMKATRGDGKQFNPAAGFAIK